MMHQRRGFRDKYLAPQLITIFLSFIAVAGMGQIGPANQLNNTASVFKITGAKKMLVFPRDTVIHALDSGYAAMVIQNGIVKLFDTTTGIKHWLDISGTFNLDSLSPKAILNQTSSAQNASFLINNTGRVNGFLGVNAPQQTVEKFGVVGSSLMKGQVDIVNGGLTISNIPQVGAIIRMDDQAGRIGVFQVQSQGMFFGTETPHRFTLIAGSSSKLIFDPSDPAPIFIGISPQFPQRNLSTGTNSLTQSFANATGDRFQW
jgi:hypothetical protein